MANSFDFRKRRTWKIGFPNAQKKKKYIQLQLLIFKSKKKNNNKDKEQKRSNKMLSMN